MSERKASDVFVECLEAEGVKYVFGIPGEETLDLNESLADSSIDFVPVRHEQGGAYMADAYGRLTGRAGVCLGTLGPGATNLVTAVADAFLDRSPLVALTGQSDLERMHKESHQYIDLLAIMRPVVKWNARVSSPEIVPEVVRKAFKVAESEKPGSTHLELPEDVMMRPLDASPLPRHAPVQPEPGMRELQRATEVIMAAERPIILAGNGAIRTHASRALRAFVHTTGIPVAETFMAKGLLDYEDPHALGTVGLQARDYELAGFEDADVVIAVGYDLVEHKPEHWNPHANKKIVVIDTVAAEIDEFFMPEVELIGDIASVLARLAAGCSRKDAEGDGCDRLRKLVFGALRDAREDDQFPMRPPRVLSDIRHALRRCDVLVSDVGLHKLWIGRMFPAHEPGTVLIANGLAGMGFALPTGIAAKLVDPDRHVVTVSGDGGFLMNCQELETAVRLKTPVVNIIWENGQYGSIVWKQDKKFGRHFGVDFGNPDFVMLAEAFGAPAWRCATADEFSQRLGHALTLDVPSVIVVPIDYSVDVAISRELGAETVAT
ncbi:MAG TPA: acetolactate synthase large subunit [Solirubrobacteraceae bacterium]|jgi:acetolactate synthase-1/2/3 large subunit|nr:acetolactate synthase large subunit [Solirubrobacteraceae bacterium]